MQCIYNPKTLWNVQIHSDVDEYLMSKGADGQQACVKNEQGENNLHIIAGIVEGVCFLNNHGEYTKLSCEGDTVTYETFPGMNPLHYWANNFNAYTQMQKMKIVKALLKHRQLVQKVV